MLQLHIRIEQAKGKQMAELSNDQGILSVLAKRLVDERLPKAIALKEKVDQGNVLEDRDIAFLEQVLADSRSIPLSVRDDPQFQDIGVRMLNLYSEITSKALENEKAQQRS